MPRALSLYAAGLAGSVLLVSSAAHSDDWPQFRKDGGRTGHSVDRVKAPLTEIWTWSTRGFKGETPLYHPAIANGRVYFLARDGTTRYLVCANAKSGSVLWRQTMTNAHFPSSHFNTIGPSVSGMGKVFVYDYRAGKLPPTAANLHAVKGDLNRVASNLTEVGGYVIRVFEGGTGRLIDLLPLAMVETLGDVPQFDLRHGPSVNQLDTGGLRNSNRPPPAAASFVLGPPLLSGEQLIATAQLDAILQWMPGQVAQVVQVAHPKPGPIPDTVRPELAGFPPVTIDNGFLLADDQRHRFLALVGGSTWHRWHRDIQNIIGLPSARDNLVVAGLGAPGGTRTVTAVNAATGLPIWSYPRPNLASELQRYSGLAIRVRSTSMAGSRDSVMARIAERQGDSDAAARFRQRDNERIRSGRRGPRLRVNELREFALMPHLESVDPPGHLSSAGVVITDGRVYAEVDGSIAALDRGSGVPHWVYRMPASAYLQSMAASHEHLFACYTLNKGSGRVAYWNDAAKRSPSHEMVAIRQSDGQVVWRQAVSAPGSIALSEGLVYFANGDLTVLGPAERTYLLAADSSDGAHYTAPVEPTPLSDPTANPALVPVADAMREAAARKRGELAPGVQADASILRLSFATDAAELVKQVKERADLLAAKEVPLALQLDWLDANRAAVVGIPGGHWTAAEEARFVKLCSRLAAEAGPQYFDLAPEVNVYLRRYPDRFDAVARLLIRAATAVREAASGCQVVASVNVEVLLGAYGKGLEHPFGVLPRPDGVIAGQQLAALSHIADVVGLTLRPQSAFKNAGVIPPDYLLRIRALLPQKPLIISRIRIDADARGDLARAGQAAYGQKILQNCYWLNCLLIASPEFSDTATAAERARALDPVRLVAEKWRSVVGWERVARLTVPSPVPLSNGAEEAKPPSVEGL